VQGKILRKGKKHRSKEGGEEGKGEKEKKRGGGEGKEKGGANDHVFRMGWSSLREGKGKGKKGGRGERAALSGRAWNFKIGNALACALC